MKQQDFHRKVMEMNLHTAQSVVQGRIMDELKKCNEMKRQSPNSRGPKSHDRSFLMSNSEMFSKPLEAARRRHLLLRGRCPRRKPDILRRRGNGVFVPKLQQVVMPFHSPIGFKGRGDFFRDVYHPFRRCEANELRISSRVLEESEW
jgi:hypothetical protein